MTKVSGKPDCISCPSYLTRAQAAAKFKTDPGAAVCDKFGHVLSRPGMEESQDQIVRESFAGRCSDYMKAKPLVNSGRAPLAQIAYADPAIMQQSSDPTTRPENCAECEHCAPASLVMDELGWHLPACTATGRLLFVNYLEATAQQCEYGVQGASLISTLDEMTLLPQYEEAFNLIEAVKTGAVAWSSGQEQPDPREYPTDRELTALDKSDGLLAWRKIEDPHGYGEPVFWPVLDPEFIRVNDPIEYEKIPFTGSATNPELYVDWQGLAYEVAACLLKLGKTPMFVGSAGTGKTELGIVFAWLSNMPMDRISITAGMNLGDFLGELRFVGGETVFRPGRLPQRVQRNGVCILDEINAGEEELLQSSRSLFDGSGTLSLEGAAVPHPVTGELIVPPPIQAAPYFAPILCINPAADYINTGVRELSDADRRRFMMFRFEQPPENIEREILTRHYMKDGGVAPNEKLLDAVIKIGREIRAHIHEGALEGMTWGLASQIMAMNATKYFPIATAYMRAGGDYFEQAKRDIIAGTVSSHTEGQNIR